MTREERDQSPAEPVDREPAAHARDREPAEPGEDGPQEPPRPLGREVQGQSEAKEAVGRPHDPEIQSCRPAGPRDPY